VVAVSFLGLAPILVEEVFKILGEISSTLAARGAAVMLVEQNVEMALEIADHVCVLAGGEVVRQGHKGALSTIEIGELYLR
jgi:branched-chain amino acid transport system ATP-binding protein